MSVKQIPDYAVDTAAHLHQAKRVYSQERLVPYLFLLPALLIIVIFRLYPLIRGVEYSLTGGIGHNRTFVGLENYQRLLTDHVFLDSLINVAKVILILPIWVTGPLCLAVLIYLKVPGHGFFRAAYFFPVVLSPIIIGSIFNIILRVDGPLNMLLDSLGVSPLDWLGDSYTALYSVAGVQWWATFGLSLLIFLAGLATMPPEILDAAKIDGANLFQLFFHIIIPYMTSTIEFVVVTTTIGILTSMFGLLFIMTGGGPGTASMLPEYFIWQQQGKLNNPTYAAAAGLVFFLVLGILAILQIRLMSAESEAAE